MYYEDDVLSDESLDVIEILDGDSVETMGENNSVNNKETVAITEEIEEDSEDEWKSPETPTRKQQIQPKRPSKRSTEDFGDFFDRGSQVKAHSTLKLGRFDINSPALDKLEKEQTQSDILELEEGTFSAVVRKKKRRKTPMDTFLSEATDIDAVSSMGHEVPSFDRTPREPQKSTREVTSVDVAEPLTPPPAISYGTMSTSKPDTISSNKIVDFDKLLSANDYFDESTLDPELLQLKENFNSSLDDEVNKAPLNIEFRAFYNDKNEIPKQSVVFKIKGSDTMEKAMKKYQEIHKLSDAELAFTSNGVVISKYATPGTLKLSGRPVIDVMTKEFFNYWREQDMSMVDVEVVEEQESQDNANEELPSAKHLITIRLNTKGRLENVSVGKEDSFETLQTLYIRKHKLDESTAIVFKVDGEKVADMSRTIEDFDLDEDDQVDVYVL